MYVLKCNATVYRGPFSGPRQCNKRAWKDGKCNQHHPDSVKVRRERILKRCEEKRKTEPWYLLREAQRRIQQLEAEVNRLHAQIDRMS